MAHCALLSKVPIPGDNIYRMRGEIAPEEAAKKYGLMLKEKFGIFGLDIVSWEWVMTGIPQAFSHIPRP